MNERLRSTLLAAATALALAAPAGAQTDGSPEGVQRDVGRTSRFAKLVPAEQVEAAAGQQYLQTLSEARNARALLPESHPQLRRLRAIAARIVPYAAPWNPRASQWRWEINLIDSDELNAFCMPGGKIAFYSGLLKTLQLDDDEVAQVMGHEIAHALREHARERIGKSTATSAGAGLLSSLLGLGSVGNAVLDISGQLLTMKFSREDESEADLVGMELAARAGYDPRAGLRLWQKMAQAAKGAPPEWLSTHPAGSTRMQEIEATLPKVLPIYERAAKPPQRFAPAPR